MSKSMNILNDHAHMRVGTCIVKYQNALSRNEISTQLTNTNYNSWILECKMKIKQNILSTTVDNQ